MFEEGVKIKPKLSNKDAKELEDGLGKRILKPIDKFEKAFKGIKKIIGLGAVTGAISGAMNSLLEPLDKLEARLKEMYGISEDLTNLADKYGTSAGKVKRIQDLAQVQGLNPDELMGMIESFRKNRNLLAVKDENGRVVKNKDGTDQKFQGKNVLEEFYKFIQNLKTTKDIPRRYLETQIFGEEQFGPAKRFINSNQNVAKQQLKSPSIQRINTATERSQKLAYKDRLMNVQRETKSYDQRGNSNNGYLFDILQKRRDEEEKLTRDQEQNARALEKILDVQIGVKKAVESVASNTLKTVQLFEMGWNNVKSWFGVKKTQARKK